MPRAPERRSALSLKGKALQWLAQREHSRLELARKLFSWQAQAMRAGSGHQGDGPAQADDRDPAEIVAAIDDVLDHLTRAGLLSDERFSQSRVHLRKARFGNRRIEHELKQHGLSPTSEQLAELRSSEVERAVLVLRARFKWSPIEAPNREQLQRSQRFLAGRGFSSDTIRQALLTVARAEPEDGRADS